MCGYGTMGEPGGGAFGVRRKRFRRAVPGRRQGDVFVSILAQNSALRTLLETRLPDLRNLSKSIPNMPERKIVCP